MASTAPPAPMLVPADYYERIHEVEQTHPWHRGMRAISGVLLGDRLSRGGRVLDAGCGTGGFLRWMLNSGPFTHACGTDVSAEALALAEERVPEAELSLAPLHELPYAAGSFDVVVVNDVLQHVPEPHVGDSVAELRRVLDPAGVLLLRTNGALRARRERDDWRIYDRASLTTALGAGGLRCRRVTYANLAGSAWALVRGRAPRAPDEHRHGIPAARDGGAGALAHAILLAESRYLGATSRSLPYGHTLLALATPR